MVISAISESLRGYVPIWNPVHIIRVDHMTIRQKKPRRDVPGAVEFELTG